MWWKGASPLSIMFAVCILYMALIILLWLLFLFCWVFLNMKGCWIVSNTFFCVNWDNHIVFLFLLLMCHITLIHFHTYGEWSPCTPGINSTLSLCITLLLCCWIMLASILLRVFVSMFIRGMAFSYLLLQWYQDYAGLKAY